MKGQRYVAVAAVQRMLAGWTEHKITVTAPVQKQNCLLLFRKYLMQTLGQRLTYQINTLLRYLSLSQIDELHFGHR
ncbi:hypothetical protein ES703_103736 [subsurface metagenome]